MNHPKGEVDHLLTIHISHVALVQTGRDAHLMQYHKSRAMKHPGKLKLAESMRNGREVSLQSTQYCIVPWPHDTLYVHHYM